MSAKGLEELLDPVPEESEITEVTTLKDFLPRGYLSVSQVNTYLGCPRQYYLRYIEKKPTKTSLRMLDGTFIHKGVEVTLEEKRRTGKNPQLELTLDTYSDTFNSSKQLINDWEETSEDKAKNNGIALCKTWHKHALPENAPIDVERAFVHIIGNDEDKFPLVGRIDSIGWVLADPKTQYDHTKIGNVPTIQRKVQDLKVVGMRWSDKDLENDLQFAMYSYVTEIQNLEVNMVIKSKAKTQPLPKYESKSAVVSQANIRHGLNVIQDVAKSIASGNFPRCSPDNFLCSEKWCGVWEYCRGAK
jgi:hypothetical protein